MSFRRSANTVTKSIWRRVGITMAMPTLPSPRRSSVSTAGHDTPSLTCKSCLPWLARADLSFFGLIVQMREDSEKPRVPPRERKQQNIDLELNARQDQEAV